MYNTKAQCCGNCKWNCYSPDGDGWRNGKFYCGNEGSYNYRVPVFSDDTCEDYKTKCESTTQE